MSFFAQIKTKWFFYLDKNQPIFVVVNEEITSTKKITTAKVYSETKFIEIIGKIKLTNTFSRREWD